MGDLGDQISGHENSSFPLEDAGAIVKSLPEMTDSPKMYLNVSVVLLKLVTGCLDLVPSCTVPCHLIQFSRSFIMLQDSNCALWRDTAGRLLVCASVCARWKLTSREA